MYYHTEILMDTVFQKKIIFLYLKNIIIFGADMSSPVDIEKKSKKIIILGEGTTQELDDTTLTAKSKYGNFVYITKKKICIKSAI